MNGTKRFLSYFIKQRQTIAFSCYKRPLSHVQVTQHNRVVQCQVNPSINRCHYATSSNNPIDAAHETTKVVFEDVCSETLDSLCEYFDNLVESTAVLDKADINYGDGVLTINLARFGTYVINRQAPNQQIWLSSPTSGPKRYDLVRVDDRFRWVYKHQQESLHRLLEREFSEICGRTVDLSGCRYYS